MSTRYGNKAHIENEKSLIESTQSEQNMCQ